MYMDNNRSELIERKGRRSQSSVGRRRAQNSTKDGEN